MFLQGFFLDIFPIDKRHLRTHTAMLRTRFFLILEIATVVGAIALYLAVVRPWLPTAQSTVLSAKLIQTLKTCRGDIDIKVVKSLLQKGASPNAANSGSDTFTALIIAAGKGQSAIVVLLLDSGADVNSTAEFLVRNDSGNFVLHGFTALSSAAMSGNAQILKTLIDHGADIHAVDSRGSSIMFWARSNEVVQILLDHGLDINARDLDGFTLLIMSCLAATADDPHRFAARSAPGRGVPDVSFLLRHGADPNIKSNTGITPLNASVSRPELVEVLKNAGAKE
jgi:ankyrin repeat protein